MSKESAELWQTVKSPDGGNRSRGGDRKGELLLDGQAAAHADAELWPTLHGICVEHPRQAGPTGNELGNSVTHHSSSTQASPVNQPLAPASEQERMMTAGSGRRLSRSLSDSNLPGACLKILLESSRWTNPLRLLEWTTRVVGRDEHYRMYSRDLFNSDTSSRETVQAFRVCRLSLRRRSERPTDGTAAGSCAGEGDLWNTIAATEARQGYQDRTRGKKGTQVSLTTEAALWATVHGTASTGPGSEGRDGGDNIQTQIASQTGQPPSSSEEQTEPRGSLNPAFACWLQGYPAGWLSYADSETQ